MWIFDNLKGLFQDRGFLRKAAVLAVPVALQNLMNTFCNLLDTLMIGRLDTISIAAVGLANKVFFVFSLLVFGVCSGSSVLAAQYWGNRDCKSIKKVLGLALTLSLLSSLLFVIPSLLNPEAVMSIFTNSPESIRVGARYLRIACLCYPMIAISNVIVAMQRSVGRVKAPVFTGILSIVINLVFNYTLIYGNFGFPRLEVAGAAVATCTSRLCEMLILITVVYAGRSPIAARVKELFGYKLSFIRLFFATALPVIINEFMWGLGVTMYSLAYGRMGDDAVAAITISGTIQDLAVVLFAGLSAACAVILGNELGAGKMERAERYAKNFFTLQFLIVLVSAALLFVGRWRFIRMYNVSDQVALDISRCICIFIAYMPFKMFNYVNIVGVLRSGGDTKMCLFLDTSGVWFLGVPLAFIGGLVLKLPIYWVYALVLSEEIYKMALGYPRYRKKIWLRNLAQEGAAS